MLHTFIGSGRRPPSGARSASRSSATWRARSTCGAWARPASTTLSPRKRADLLEYAFERYYQKTALLGTLASCGRMVEAVSAAGVDEIACLVDFGVDPAAIMTGLEHLDELRQAACPAPTG